MSTNLIVTVNPTNELTRSTPYAEALRTFIANQRSDCTKATYWSNLRAFGAWLSKPIEVLCPRCGGPIPVGLAGMFSCSYCGTTLRL